MYEAFFGLRETPFAMTADPRFLMMTAQHREALSVLDHGVRARKGLILLTGEAGTGKSTLLRQLFNELLRDAGAVVYLANPTLGRSEFVHVLADGFSLSAAATTSKAVLLSELERLLKFGCTMQRPAALLIDEAQSLPDDLLEEVRLLANLEDGGAKLLPVVLAAQPPFRRRLDAPEFSQFRQRIALRCELHPLNPEQTAAYIQHRVAAAGGEAGTLFSREAVAEIHERTSGVPRIINALCDNALITGLAEGCRPVTREIVCSACDDLALPPPDAAAAVVSDDRAERWIHH